VARDEVRWLETVGSGDVEEVGGKNASLGEMIAHLTGQGIRVPGGFATTAAAFRSFVEANGLDEEIRRILGELADGERELAAAGSEIRGLFDRAEFPASTADAIRSAYEELGKRYDTTDVDVAVRSSATAEDLPDASFAGQQDTYLNVVGADALLAACKDCYASLFTDRAISYRVEQGFDHHDVALSIGVQKMVRSDLASAGVMFTIDTDTGFPDTAIVNGSWGLGENVVGGEVTPDQWTVYKPFLENEDLVPILARTVGAKEKKRIYTDEGPEPTVNVDTTDAERRALVLDDDEVLALARWGALIERHYGRPMDVEWAKDGRTGELFVVQARPETVQSRAGAGRLSTFSLDETGELLVSGLAIGQAVAAGEVQVISSAEQADQFVDGRVLVTTMTDPDWVPIMKRAAGIVTDRGGRTSHAAIVSRELGVPAVVGTQDATELLAEGREVTLSCVEGDEGHVYDGILAFSERELDLESVPRTTTRVMMNIGSPAAAMQWWRLPAHGIGLARMEYLVNNVIQAHPLALLHLDDVADADAKAQIEELTAGWEDKGEYFVDHLARGIATIAASQYPEPSWCGSRTSRPTSTPGSSAGRSSSPTRRTRCWAGGGRRATTATTTARPSRWSAGRSSACASGWASPT
jgi:pyruvate, water dikinase